MYCIFIGIRAKGTKCLLVETVRGLRGKEKIRSYQSNPICPHPFDTLLEKTGDLSLSQRAQQLLCSVVRTHKLHTVDEPIQLLLANKERKDKDLLRFHCIMLHNYYNTTARNSVGAAARETQVGRKCTD